MLQQDVRPARLLRRESLFTHPVIGFSASPRVFLLRFAEQEVNMA